MANVTEIFGSMVFDDRKMQECLPRATYKTLKKTVKNGEPLDISVATAVANDANATVLITNVTECRCQRNEGLGG